MDDPFHAQIMFKIEKLIYDRDKKAKEYNLLLTDSNIKSSIRKTLGLFKGKLIQSTPNDERKQWIGRVAIELAGLSEILEKEKIERKHYTRALLAVEDSLKTQRERAGHSRGYLDFLEVFIEEARID